MDNNVYTFTEAIQLKILALLWRNEKSFSMYRETVQPKYFSNDIHIDICRILFDHYNKYNSSPSYDALEEEIATLCRKSKVKSKLLVDFQECLEKLATVGLEDEAYINSKVLEFGKRQALVGAILEGAEILEKNQNTEFNKIEHLVKEALLVGEDVNDLGVDLFENIKETVMSWTEDEDVLPKVPTGMSELDRITLGGVGKTEMFCVVAPPGRGKTSFMISAGAHALQQGYNVCHISLENNEKQIQRNYILSILNKNFAFIRENPENSIQALQNIKNYINSRLMIKKYSTKSITTNTIRRYLDQLKTVRKFEPDLLIVDYAALLRPVRATKGDKRLDIESAYEDLRALADDYNVSVWTGAQGNRSALSKKIVTMADLAECFAIANTCDGMVSLCQTLQEKSNGEMRLFLAKIRDNTDSLVLKGTVDYETKRMNFTTTMDMTSTDEDEDDDDTDEY